MVSLSNELKQVGGLWSSVSELEERLSALADEKEKCDALKVQLKFWKWVLKAKNKDGILNHSVAGKPKWFNDLLESLKEVIQQQNNSFQGSLPDTSGVSGVTDVGRRVKHMWLDENTDEEDWWCGSVLSVKENEVVIEYDEVYAEDEDDSEEYEDERVTFPLEELQQAYLSTELLFL
ncbi:hypothetical protein HOLleu_44342 [Holothuria leucospilota]|uniref:Uncharacterized protein n=1 Tax=Holothuria leucospilota TaxID=206669 RepID=A0A9Q0Y8X4_HOLLE|nr:hypothetical protein HOLleu_44342 [Holothuria leucospilota]